MNRTVLVCLLSVVLCHVAWTDLPDDSLRQSPQSMRRESEEQNVHEGELQTQNKRSKNDNPNSVGEPSYPGQRDLEGPQGSAGDKEFSGSLRRDERDTIAVINAGNTNQKGTSKGGSVFVRWGRSDCPEASDLLYSGIAAGSRHRGLPGGGANILCLPPDPSFVNPVDGVGGTRAFLFSIEYQLSDYPAWQQNNFHDVPCAVCKATGRFSHVMIPGKQTCPSSEWTLEYRGYLMAERSLSVHHKSMFVCVDHDPKIVSSSSAADSQNSGRLALVEGKCSTTGGGLPCDTYPDGKEFTCAVCTL